MEKNYETTRLNYISISRQLQKSYHILVCDRCPCVLFVEKNMTPVYTFLDDAVLSLRNEENSLENISFPSAIRQEHWSSLFKFAKNSKKFQ